MDSRNLVSRSSSESSAQVNTSSDLTYTLQDISRSLDSWKERRKLGLGLRTQRYLLKDRSSADSSHEPVCHSFVSLASDDTVGETRKTGGELENVPPCVGIDENTYSSQEKGDHEKICSGSSSDNSSSSCMYASLRPASPSFQLSHLYNEGKAEELVDKERGGELVVKKAITEIRSSSQTVGLSTTTTTTTTTTSNNNNTERFGLVSQPGAEAVSSSLLTSSSAVSSFPNNNNNNNNQQASPVSERPSSPLVLLRRSVPVSTVSVLPSSPSSSSWSHGEEERALRDGEQQLQEEESSLLLHSNRRKRATDNDIDRAEDAQPKHDKDACVVSSVDARSYPETTWNNVDTTTNNNNNNNTEEDVTRNVDNIVVESYDDNQPNISMTHNSDDDEMLDVDFTAIEATRTLDNENARQKLLLRRKSSLAQRQRPTRIRKRISESDSESESSSLNVESFINEKKKTHDVKLVDLPETSREYKYSTTTSSKVRNELSEVPPQNVLKERKDPGLRLKKEKDQENRAVLDAPPLVLRKNSANNFDNTAGSRKPLIQEVSLDETKLNSPEKVAPFGNSLRARRHHEFLRWNQATQSSEDLTNRADSPQVGNENYRNQLKNSDPRRDIHRKSFPSAEIQSIVLRSVSRRIFEDGSRTSVNTEAEWSKKRHSTALGNVVSTRDSTPRIDSNSDPKPERWSVIRKPLNSGSGNRNPETVSEKPTWFRKNLEQRRTTSYSFTPTSRESDSNESNEAPWVKEFRNSRKRVGRIFSNREAVKPGLDKPSSSSSDFTTTSSPPARIAKPLSSLVGDQSSRCVVGSKYSVNAGPTSSSTASEKKEALNILSDGSSSPKYKLDRKLSFNNANEGGVSLRMKENRSPVTRNNINTADPYLPSWSLSDAGEAPASLTDTRTDIPEWQRKLAEKNKLRKQSFRRIEDSSSSKTSTEDGSPKSQPAWRQQLKNRTTSNVEQTEKKSQEKPDWIKQVEERRARLAQNKLLGD